VTDTPISEKKASELEKSVTTKYLNDGWVVLNNMSSLGTLGGPYLIWTKEKCHEVALKCKSRSEFSKKHGSVYYSSRKNGWIDEVCSHMVQIIKPKNYWTKEKCHETALKYKSRSEFGKKSKGAYHSARKNGWLDEICSHMKKKINKPK
jgi:hypothetical protein